MQKLFLFSLPKGFRGRNALLVQLWWFVHATLFSLSPQFCYSWRAFLLRLFGADIGKSVIVRPSVEITYPWNIKIGDFSWVGDNVVLYSLGKIVVGSNSVISQRSYICAGDHDYCDEKFTIRAIDVAIGSGVWIATDVFVAPGVTVGEGAVIGARSSVFKDMPAGMVCMGHPCVPVKKRETVSP